MIKAVCLPVQLIFILDQKKKSTPAKTNTHQQQSWSPPCQQDGTEDAAGLVLPVGLYFFLMDIVPVHWFVCQLTKITVTFFNNWPLSFFTWLGPKKTITLRAPFNLFLWNGTRTKNDTEGNEPWWIHWGTDGFFSVWRWSVTGHFWACSRWHRKCLGEYIWATCAAALKIRYGSYICKMTTGIFLWFLWNCRGVCFWLTLQVIQWLSNSPLLGFSLFPTLSSSSLSRDP